MTFTLPVPPDPSGPSWQTMYNMAMQMVETEKGRAETEKGRAETEKGRADEIRRRAETEKEKWELEAKQRIRDTAALIHELSFCRAVLCDRFVLEKCAFAYLDRPEVKARADSRTASGGVRLIMSDLIFDEKKTSLTNISRPFFDELKKLPMFAGTDEMQFVRFWMKNDPFSLASTDIHMPTAGSMVGFCLGYSQIIFVKFFLALFVVVCQEEGVYKYLPAQLLNADGTVACVIRDAAIKDVPQGSLPGDLGNIVSEGCTTLREVGTDLREGSTVSSDWSSASNLEEGTV